MAAVRPPQTCSLGGVPHDVSSFSPRARPLRLVQRRTAPSISTRLDREVSSVLPTPLHYAARISGIRRNSFQDSSSRLKCRAQAGSQAEGHHTGRNSSVNCSRPVPSEPLRVGFILSSPRSDRGPAILTSILLFYSVGSRGQENAKTSAN
eukprot:1194514-Prorocentrum_minimum.AAC.5